MACRISVKNRAIFTKLSLVLFSRHLAQSWLNLKQASSAKRQTYELAGALVVIFQSNPTHDSDHVHEKQKDPTKMLGPSALAINKWT